jgi:hypothetical protein
MFFPQKSLSLHFGLRFNGFKVNVCHHGDIRHVFFCPASWRECGHSLNAAYEADLSGSSL